MKCKVKLDCRDDDGNPVELIFDAELNTDCLHSVDGFVHIHSIMGMKVDAMPDIRKE